MRKLIMLAAGAAALSASPAFAQDTDDMLVTATVVDSCTVTASPMAFGTLTTLGTANIDSSASIALACTPDAAYDVSLDLGLNAGAGTQRELVNGADTTQRIPYDVYQDAARTASWGTGTGNTVAGTATGGVATLTAYGRIPASASAVTAGSYSDSVTVTVTF
ncbi:spore coat U domain-containing protein [Pontixanthobacter aestiaquae]|uniref:Fimbrial major subunit CsuA/B family protein n=1 Tax=Pontixanthobacter aestiaquae TaxID=1509367 RepID=A0A844Z4B3_9SPHN|nr:spore coat U domain-containing protein [Pontixanthobacter aestiaquae]MDN3646902.1 spore coat U domain-containing protein [Pontixanthobacter aestiaquae]MXO82116.1 fimbrial major subunit CsuA/B family protein [Pontixanthobacter aestiaquae]